MSTQSASSGVRSRVIKIVTVTILYGGGLKASELVEFGKYDEDNWANPRFPDHLFPLKSRIRRKVQTIKLVECDYEPTDEEVLEELSYHNLEHPFYEDALVFGVMYPDEQRERRIVFLHHPVMVFEDGYYSYRVLVLDGDASKRGIYLSWLIGRWSRRCVFAGVCE